MNQQISRLRASYEQKRGKAEQIETYIKQKTQRKRRLQRSLRLNEKAQVIVQEVTKITQDQLKYHLSDLCTLAMSSVFPEPYEIVIDFVSKRGKVEAEIWFQKDGYLINPFSATGGGAIDIAALSLRFSCWTLQKPKTRPILLLDEPLKFLKGSDLPIKGAEMIHQISEKLGLQIIMVSHDPELIECADKVITVKMKNGISEVS